MNMYERRAHTRRRRAEEAVIRRRDRWACAYRTHVAEYARARTGVVRAASFRVGEEPEESAARRS